MYARQTQLAAQASGILHVQKPQMHVDRATVIVVKQIQRQGVTTRRRSNVYARKILIAAWWLGPRLVP